MTDQPAEVAAALPTSDCTICSHPDAALIDEALLGGTSVRATAGTYGLSRSSVGRHRLNHLSAEAITDPGPDRETPPLRLVDVHGQLAALADRLERVVEQAARTRKATAAVAATRELRQTLMAIAEVQSTPELQKAASVQRLNAYCEETTSAALVALFDFVLQQFGFEARDGRISLGERERILGQLVHDCLVCLQDDMSGRFVDVDTSKARAYVEQQALDRAARIEAEVQRRVEVELRRRETQQRPAIEAHERPAIEGGVPVWQA